MQNTDHQMEESKTLETLETINQQNNDDNTEICQKSNAEAKEDQEHFNLKVYVYKHSAINIP